MDQKLVWISVCLMIKIENIFMMDWIHIGAVTQVMNEENGELLTTVCASLFAGQLK
ncbi:hypothetical protein [Paenibacillus polymyxa]|uniref:hypothetical protein n=1 Tax=Paenibacillus polymyxa TaxID=1406 RepID=UPI002AB512A3|nr:hypothetical protein [Paenibacillus polymyxa]MDY8026144.1 hypothetical protein [Paenibacillus polymyxa]